VSPRTAMLMGEEAARAVCPSEVPPTKNAVNDCCPQQGTLGLLAAHVGDDEAVRQWPMLLGAYRATLAERVTGATPQRGGRDGND